MFPDTQHKKHFLAHHWQQKPCLLKQALPDFRDPLSPEELAGLACEDFIESRLVFHSQDDYQMESGPFRESRFTSLPEKDWTLLVQRVDHFMPTVKQLINLVNFIPRWRIDDIMVSYATPGGGVGPHFDYYDVFIIQGLGTRRWCTGNKCRQDDQMLTASGLKLLHDFKPVDEWILEPGDVLYIPPGYAHAGVATQNSLNYSIGFRAPSISDILTGYSDAVSDNLDESMRFHDPNPQIPDSPGEITGDVLDHLQELIREAIGNRQLLANWFGETMTSPADDNSLAPPESAFSPDELYEAIISGQSWRAAPACRFAFLHESASLILFGAGESFALNPDNPLHMKLSRLLSENTCEALPLAEFAEDSECLLCLLQLANLGAIEGDIP